MFGHPMHGLLAEVRRRAGRTAEALDAVDSALAESARTGERFHLVPLHRLRAAMLSELGRDEGTDVAAAANVSAAQGWGRP